MSVTEFDIIERYFANAPHGEQVRLGVGDDAAILAGAEQMAVTVDALVQGVHFPADAPAEAVGHKALAVNLSDLAAMGAAPAWAVLALSLAELDESWLERFAAGFLALAARHGVSLVGGDTTRGALAATTTLGGPAPRALLRSGAVPGDRIWVSGSLGDAACGLACWQRGERTGPAVEQLVTRLHRPEPRVVLGQGLRDLASAAIDVSDGLTADAGHIARASEVGALIRAEAVPCSPALAAVAGDHALDYALSGGDDYELCFTAAPDADAAIRALGERLGIGVTPIGSVSGGAGVRVEGADGQVLASAPGYRHFA